MNIDMDMPRSIGKQSGESEESVLEKKKEEEEEEEKEEEEDYGGRDL